jgi:hypothetical protein
VYHWGMRVFRDRWGVPLAALVVGAFALQSAEACSCAATAQCELPLGYGLVFTGKVVSKQVVRPAAVPGNRPPPPAPSGLPAVVTFAVSEYLRGHAGHEVRIETTDGCCACGYKFTEAVEYLVFAREDRGGWTTNTCTPTQPLRTASALIEQLRSVRSNALAAQLFGFVGRAPQDPRFESMWKTEPLESVRVRAVGTRGTFESITSTAGAYAFRELPADTYHIEASLPAGLTIADAAFRTPKRLFEVRTDTRGCEANIRVLADGQLSRVLVNAQGRPVRGSIRAIVVDVAIDPLQSSVVSHETEADGKFRLPFLAPGKYRLVVSPERVGQIDYKVRVYYPGTISESDAHVFELQTGEHIDSIRFVVPENVGN